MPPHGFTYHTTDWGLMDSKDSHARHSTFAHITGFPLKYQKTPLNHFTLPVLVKDKRSTVGFFLSLHDLIPFPFVPEKHQRFTELLQCVVGCAAECEKSSVQWSHLFLPNLVKNNPRRKLFQGDVPTRIPGITVNISERFFFFFLFLS